MTELQERDAMICRACGNEERASEGYPCGSCGTFICVICNLRGVIECRRCQDRAAGRVTPPVPEPEAPAPQAPAPAPPAKLEIDMPEWLVD